MLAEADTIQKAKELKSLALTAAEWAKRKNMGEEAIHHCRSYALEAERKMGQMLAATDLNKGGRPSKTGHRKSPVSPNIGDFGLSKRESANAQALANLDQETFNEVRSGKKTRQKAITILSQSKRREGLKSTQWPTGKFRVFYADPPWSYSDKRLGSVEGGGATGSYDTMSLDAICKMEVPALALANSVLFLWVTSPLLPDGLVVMSEWGFEYKASFVWDKIRGFNGHYNDVRHEFLLLGTKGSCTPEISKLTTSIIRAERGKHSSKPGAFATLIDKLYPSGPRLELFARNTRKGWTQWGDQLT